MQTFYAYQARFVVTGLTNLAEELELAELPLWHTIASAAACLERLMYGEQPADLATVVASLKALKLNEPYPRRTGKLTFLLVDLSITLIDGIRLGLIEIMPKLKRPTIITPVWIGLDMGTDDRTVYANSRLLNGLRDDVEHLDNPAHQLTEQRLGQLLADPQQNLTHHVAPRDELKGATVRPATSDARHYDQCCSEVRHA